MLGQDPLNLKDIVKNMDVVIQGNTFAKSAIDMACWDIKAKDNGVPLFELLGGMLTDGVQTLH